MDIKFKKIPIRHLVSGYINKPEVGVKTLNSKYTILQPYEPTAGFTPLHRQALINSIMRRLPIGMIFLSYAEAAGCYEVIDGRQRLLTICQFYNDEFEFQHPYEGLVTFSSMSKPQQNRFINYQVGLFEVTGFDRDKAKWFVDCNVQTPKSNHEIIFAVYAGPFLTEARHFFCNDQGAAMVAAPYLAGNPAKGDWLYTAVDWTARKEAIPLISFLERHQFDLTPHCLTTFFEKVITWTSHTFPVYRPQMKGVDWSGLYLRYGDRTLDADALEAEVARLLAQGVVDGNQLYGQALEATQTI